MNTRRITTIRPPSRTERHRRRPVSIAIGVTVALATLLAGSTATTITATAAAPQRDIALILDYRVVASCAVYPNYPKEGVIGNQIGWRISPGEVVAWRYNVNNTWAMISDKKYRKSSTHPWWGFTKRSCIGGSIGGEPYPTPDSSYPAGVPIPSRILSGRSAVDPSGYRPVNFRPSPGHVVNDYKAIKSKGTLRDARGRFVIGNVFAGWHVHLTNQHDGPWTKVYVPNAKRWGWVMNTHL